MSITWSEELEVGAEIMDTQHKALIEKYNVVISACDAGRGQEELEDALSFLCDYTVKHFSHEEALQRQMSYPEYSRHKQLHEDFKATVADLAAQFKQNGPSSAILEKFNTDVGEWLINHIKGEDTKVASYGAHLVDFSNTNPLDMF